YNLNLTSLTHYNKSPNTPLPKQATLALQFLSRNSKRTINHWMYFDNNLNQVAEEFPSEIEYNPHVRSWYQNAIKTPGLHWSDVYLFYPSEVPGITASKAIYREDGSLIGVVAADLSFLLLSNFLKQLQIGKTGKVFIVNHKNQIVLPEINDKELKSKEQQLVNDSLVLFAKENEANFTYEANDITYLSHINILKNFFGQNGKMVLVVPLKEYFVDFIDMQNHILIFSIVVLLIAILFIFIFSARISRPIMKLTEEIAKICKFDLSSEVRVKSNIKEIFIMDNAIASLRAAVRSFARYVPKEVVRNLIEKGKDIELGGEKKELTIMFSDIKDFTAISEQISIDDLTHLLEEYFDSLTHIILDHKGTIDKYIGDCVMSFWGAPIDLPDQAHLACESALYSRNAIQAFNKKRREEGKPEFHTRFGINTGHVIVGNIGTHERMNYTAIGDPINTSYRLQLIDKDYHTIIMISESVKAKINERFLIRPIDIVAFKGKAEKTKIYELMGCEDPKHSNIVSSDRDRELAKEFTKAYDLYAANQMEEALALFKQIYETYPEDHPTEIYIKRIESILKKL
ncbi:MAG: hypothetical protein K9M13_00785, partial [Simkaniaceae bacterium]|nr:hypothetical protein [Simkaniaceae bacterium]